MPTHTFRDEEQMVGVAEEVLSILPQKNTAHVLALKGDLGAGKTAFVKALAAVLGIVDHVTSPTFVIMKMYAAKSLFPVTELIHIDAYRVEDVAEMKVLRLDELFKKKGALICIEWPENIQTLMPPDALTISISLNEDHTRTVRYEA